MQLVATEDQELLAKTAADFVSEKSPVSRFRALRDSNDPLGFSRELWKEMAELGWAGILFPESLGGAELGLAEMAVVLEELGRKLAPEPFLSTVLLGGQALLLGGSESQQKEWLPRVASGDAVLGLAYQEANSRFDLCRVGLRAEPAGSGWRLSGEKVQVLDGCTADALVVSARAAGGESDREGVNLFLVPANAPGLSREPQQRVDSRAAALLRFDGVEVGAADRLGDEDAGSALLERVVDRACVGLCAEMLGGMREAFELTLEHLKTRQQFGTVIGTFQALKHRAARCFMEVELSRSVVMAAARALDGGNDDARLLVCLAKARCSDAFVQLANEGIQMFGGVGMTDEYDIGLYLKRARAAEMTFGDAAWQRQRWAQLCGY